jgi:hypothetical protein
LTPEIGARVREGVGRLTEEEVLKLVPWTVCINMGVPGDDFDYVMTWDEARRIRVEFCENKVVATTAAFSDGVTSKTLTLANFKKITKGMVLADVEKILEGPAFKGSYFKRFTLDASGKEVGVCEWIQGQRIFARIKGGRVTGAGYVTDPK